MFGPYKIGWWRRLKMIPRRARLGFWPDELWNLDSTIARFTLPRLREYRRTHMGYWAGPDGNGTAVQYDEKLDETIWALQTLVDDDLDLWFDIEQVKRRNEGLKLFGDLLPTMWD